MKLEGIPIVEIAEEACVSVSHAERMLERSNTRVRRLRKKRQRYHSQSDAQRRNESRKNQERAREWQQISLRTATKVGRVAWTDEEVEYLKASASTTTKLEMAIHLSRTYLSVHNKLIKMKLSCRSSPG